jgi:hypothetical protein
MVFPFLGWLRLKPRTVAAGAFALELNRTGWVVSTRNREWLAEQWSLRKALRRDEAVLIC